MDVKPCIKTGTDGQSRESNVTLDGENRPTIPNQSELCEEEREFYRIMFGTDIASVRYHKLHCTACDTHIGSAPAEANNMWAHPVLRTLLCAACREFYGDGDFEQGEDATDMFCRWCANGGNLYCCSFCSNTFCNKCIRRNFEPSIRKTIEDDETWKCFVCDPKDLYTARAVCWALLQHVRTVTRILRNDKSLPNEEFRERMMNLDESKCCQKRRRRRRKNRGSDSEGEDETYRPDLDELSLSERRRIYRKVPRRSSSSLITNGEEVTLSPISRNLMKTRFTTNSFSVEHEDDDLPPPMIPCEQSMVEGESTETLIGTLTTEPCLSALSSGGNAATPQPQSQPQINPIPTANLLKSTLSPSPIAVNYFVRNKHTRQLQRILPRPKTKLKMLMVQNSGPNCPPTSTNVHTIEYSSLPLRASNLQPNVPMVAIPTISSGYGQSTSVQTPKTRQSLAGRSSPAKESPVIEIDSDSDESGTPEPSGVEATTRESREVVNIRSNPPECVPAKNRQESSRFAKKVVIERSRNVIENELDFRTEEVRLLFKTIGAELKKIPLLELADINNVRSMRIKTRRFHHAVARAMSELSEINDKVIHKYTSWRKVARHTRKSKKATDHDHDDDDDEKRDGTNDDHPIPLDMVCTNSGSESDNYDDDDDDDDDEYDSDEYSLANKVRSIKIFQERDTVDVGVGEPPSTEDKSVQAYDVVDRDYEKCIGHSVLTKLEYDPTDGSEVFKPVIVPAEHNGKYEEQFIFYLQQREEEPMETDDEKGLPDPNETPLKDLIEANSPFVLEMLESIGSPPLANGAVSRDGNKADAGIETEAEPEAEVDTGTGAEASDESGKENKEREGSTNVVKELAKMVTELSEDLKTCRNTDSLLKKHSEHGKKDKRKQIFDRVDTEEVDVAVQALIEDDERSKSSNNDDDSVTRHVKYLVLNDKTSPVRASDDECTIID